MNRINLIRTIAHRNNSSATPDSVAWGKINQEKINQPKINQPKINQEKINQEKINRGKTNSNFENTASTLVFAAALIVCSIAVGCSRDNSKALPSNSQRSASPNPTLQTLANSNLPAPIVQPEKPAAKKVVRKRPATVAYVDKNHGISFEYPRRYAIETGDAATEVLASSPLPMNFVMPGGNAVAAVELPETGFANTDFASAFFNVSVNKNISAEDCGKFAVPQSESTSPPASAVPSDSVAKSAVEQPDSAKTKPQAATDQLKGESAKPIKPPNQSEVSAQTSGPDSATVSGVTPAAATTPSAPAVPTLMLSDMQTQKAEAVSGEGNRQSDSKYLHVYQNGACYEFALNVTTLAAQNDGEMKHVDRDKVFGRLEKILATVKITPIEAEKETDTSPAPATSAGAAGTPAQ